jgi:hypothetical protein
MPVGGISGRAIRTGFAAMGVAETVMHTYDITQGLRVSWVPPESLCAAVCSPMLPPVTRSRSSSGAPDEPNWMTFPRLTSWVWKAAVS